MAKTRLQDELKRSYRKTFEVALVVSLFLHLILFQGLRAVEFGQKPPEVKPIKITVEEVPLTRQVRRPPPPELPSVPIPTESEEVPEDVTIRSTELNLSELPPPPPPPGQEENIEAGYVFVPYDQAPQLVGGMDAIKRNLVYPELARKAGIEGLVIVGVLIDEEGRPIKTQILKASGVHIGFEEAATAAVMKTRWIPAKQRDKAVKVWVSIPIHFRLHEPSKLPS